MVMMPDQRSLTDQLQDLVSLANRHHLYDAADFISIHVLHQSTAIQHRHASIYDRRVAGHMSWREVNELAKRHGGQLDKHYVPRDVSLDDKWDFENEDGFREFVKVLGQKHMGFNARESDNKDTFSVTVWL